MKRKYITSVNLALVTILVLSQFNGVLSVKAIEIAEQNQNEIEIEILGENLGNEVVTEEMQQEEEVILQEPMMNEEVENEVYDETEISGIEIVEEISDESIVNYSLKSRNAGTGLVQLWQVIPGGQEWRENVDYNTYKNALTCKPNHDLYKRSNTKFTHDTYVNSCYVDDALYLGEDDNNYKIYVSGYEGWVPKSSTKYISLDLNNDGVTALYEVKVEAYFVPEGSTARAFESSVQDVEVLDFANEYLKEDVYLEELSIVTYSTSTVQSPSYYANEGGFLYHYLSKDVTRPNYYSKVIVGKAPNWMQVNKKYYSYDGIYFYDYWQSINVNGWGAVNRDNPFYNYYQYLPFRSTTNYNAVDIDNYTKQNGYTVVATTYPATNNASLLVNTGSIFKSVETKYGINGALQYAMGIHESGWGRSSISITKNNLFGMNATDNNPYGNATGFPSVQNGIYYHAERYLSWGYTNPLNDKRYYGSHVGNKGSGMNVSYASDPFWGEKIAGWYYRLDQASGSKDYNYYSIGIKTSGDNYNVRNQASINSKPLYLTKNGKTGSKIYNYPVLITGESNRFYKIKTDIAINVSGNPQYNDTYVWNRTNGFIDKGAISVVNHTNYKDVNINNTDVPQVPIDEYIGNVNAQLNNFKLDSNSNGSYVNGEIIIVEWINGQSNVPTTLPAMKLKSTDGKTSYDMFVTPTGTNTYYFDSYINHVDLSKQYYLEVSLTNNKNVSTQKSMYVTTNGISSSATLGVFNKRSVKYISNNNLFKLYFEEINNNYIGNINSELRKIALGTNDIGTYLNGEIVVVEWINGKSTVPTTLPAMKLKSTDGKKSYDMFITPTGTNTYYFDIFINHVDLNQEYYIEVSLTNPDNISTQKIMNVETDNATQISPSATLGQFSGKNVNYYTDGKTLKLAFPENDNKYIGNVNSELKRIELLPNNIGTYLTGEFVIVEWVNGQSTVPTTTPRVVLKSTDGVINHEMFITPTGTNTYYFDSYIHEMDASKEYYVEVSLTHPDNVSPNKSMYLRTDTSPAISDSGILGYMNGKTVSFYSVSGEMLLSIK